MMAESVTQVSVARYYVLRLSFQTHTILIFAERSRDVADGGHNAPAPVTAPSMPVKNIQEITRDSWRLVPQQRSFGVVGLCTEHERVRAGLSLYCGKIMRFDVVPLRYISIEGALEFVEGRSLLGSGRHVGAVDVRVQLLKPCVQPRQAYPFGSGEVGCGVSTAGAF